MPKWAIGPITGQYQPEDLTESQEAEFEDQENIGGMIVMTFKQWAPREVTVSFVVDGIGTDIDPEDVWAAILEIQRPRTFLRPRPIVVNLPGWGGVGRNVPTKAVIVSASIQRTHIQSRTEADLRKAPVSSSSLENPRGSYQFTKEEYERIGRAGGLNQAKIDEATGRTNADAVQATLLGNSNPIKAARATITLTLKEVAILKI